MDYIGANMKYPEPARDSKIEGVVEVSFTIDENGKVTDVSVVKGLDKLCDDEAVRVIKQMPDWIPQQVEGVRFRTNKKLPVVFALDQVKEELKGE
jgi:protein TonB